MKVKKNETGKQATEISQSSDQTSVGDLIFYDGRSLTEKDVDIFEAVFNKGIRNFLLKRSQVDFPFFPKSITKYIEIETIEDLQGLPEASHVVSSKDKILRKAEKSGHTTSLYCHITNAEDFYETVAKTSISRCPYIFIELKDDTNIPLELIIAKNQSRKSTIVKKVSTVEQGKVALGIMEVGVHGFMLANKNLEEISELGQWVASQGAQKMELKPAVVKGISYIGDGYRSCIDTTTLMTKKEGMIVGSTSRGGLLVCSETHFLPYMNLRPFRVNAGAVHSYVWGPEKAEYLSDLKCGSRVLCVDTKGNARVASIGRMKTEVRPLLLIEAVIEGHEINTILQDDWHVRVMGVDGEAKNITDLKPGDQLLGAMFEPGRHVGIQIAESIEEK
ncbi:MAG: 3-dehydroquinate synthase [Candidatus Electrothrix sp. MAN1_4]|nr:3-dehydroquinate synthase [Candidatus Electrothrix sp. MAN1_4]